MLASAPEFVSSLQTRIAREYATIGIASTDDSTNRTAIAITAHDDVIHRFSCFEIPQASSRFQEIDSRQMSCSVNLASSEVRRVKRERS